MLECRKREPAALCCALLALLTLAVYLPVMEARFVTFDDSAYLTDNATVQAGLTWEGLRWAFTGIHSANWHPLSWLSHMLDCQLFGLDPWGHHLANLLLHTANTLMLFGLLRQLTGTFWRSAFVAALFALHPLHVESVAWVAERKDVLSTFFFLLSLWAYASYAGKAVAGSDRNPAPELRTADHPLRYYLLALAFFALGLTSKPMLVTVPFVLLLLDYWPLGRLGGRGNEESGMENLANAQCPGAARKGQLSRILLEKLPFLVLSAASSVVTVMAQRKGGALASLEGESAVTLASRLVNTPIAYVWYLAKTVWPSHLAVIYPFVRMWPLWEVLLATALLVAMTGAALWLGRRKRYLAVGWLWYLGTLLPVIGLVKVGAHAIADRYMYIPSIGLFVALAWGVADLTAHWARRAVPLALGAAAVLVACAVATGAQLLYWLDTETLFRHALAVTRDNYVACDILGYYLGEQGQPEAAKKYYRAALEISPDYVRARKHLGATLVRQGNFEEAVAALEGSLSTSPPSAEVQCYLGVALYCLGKNEQAIDHLRQAIRLEPQYSLAHYDLGEVLVRQGKLDQAVAQFRETIRLQPSHQPSWVQLGLARASQARPAEAVEAFSVAVRLKPKDVEAQCHLAAALATQHQIQEAVQHYETALKLAPDLPDALNNLAWILAANPDPQARNGRKAVELAERACKLTGFKQPLMVGTLAAAYAEAGRFTEAVATAEKAEGLAEQSRQPELAARNRALLEHYRSGQPARDAP